MRAKPKPKSKSSPALKVRVVDKAGKLLDLRVDLEVRHRKLNERVAQKGVDASQVIEIADLRRGPDGEYQVTVNPTGRFKPQSQFVNVPARGAATATFTFDEKSEADVNDIVTLAVATYTVAGTVFSPDNPGIGELTVAIVDKSAGPDYHLISAKTDDRGRYKAAFPAAAIQERRKQQPDLQARVFHGDTFLGASDVHYDAAELEIIDVSLPRNAAALPAEHQSLTAAIARHYDGRLSALEESDDRQDISYLGNKTGWDARAVAMAALAEGFSEESDIDAPLFYALFRAGLPASPESLYRTDSATVANVWKQSIEQGVIAKEHEDDLPRALETFKSKSAKTILTARPPIGNSPMNEMLSVSGLGTNEQQRFVNLYVEHRGDKEKFWSAVSNELGERAKRLQVDGTLAFLTVNNAPLMNAVHAAAGEMKDPVRLAEIGLHRAEAWEGLLSGGVEIPKEIPGKGEEQRRNYAAYLAAQVRVSYPTAAVAQMVGSGELRVGAREQVKKFLDEHQGKFEIGVQPVEQYLKRNALTLPEATLAEVKKLQRLYQITPDDKALAELLAKGIDSAYQIVNQSRESFIHDFAPAIGIEAAEKTYDRAMQIHNTVFNIAVSYINAANSIELGAPDEGTGTRQLLRAGPAPKAGAGDVIAYPTLETLFGSMDFCACEHCRSVLSPAAYLVDLLMFIDRVPTDITKKNPQTILFGRRPDIPQLPLTCENTNTALPYIDIVNETLEYFVFKNFSLIDFAGHDTGESASEDLVATPQHVIDTAYGTLKTKYFPPPLPFNQSLESARAHFDKFGTPLPLAMERLRANDDLERGGNPYGWRDILMEELGFSRQEHDILTDSGTVPLWTMYGLAAAASDTDVAAKLANAKEYTRLAGITYEELVAILRTRFVNPTSDLLPRFERLRVPIELIVELKTKNDNATDTKFENALPKGASKIDEADYGGSIKNWAKNQANYDGLLALITLSDPSSKPNPCDFSKLEFRLFDPDNTKNKVGPVPFARMYRLIRLWKKTGWSIEQTDAAICALYNANLARLTAADVDTIARLDAGFRKLLPRLGVAVRVARALGIDVKRDLLSILALWAEIGTHGEGSLYRRMFLNPTILAQDTAFAPNINGDFLKDNNQKIAGHAQALRSAFNLTGDEYAEIFKALYGTGDPVLNIENVSAIFRRGWLARRLRISVRELLLLMSVSGLDPFAAPDSDSTKPEPDVAVFIALVQALKDRSLKTAVALYLIWGQDLSGKSAPAAAQIEQFLRSLRGDFADIDQQLAATEDPNGDVARSRMTLVYGEETTAAFFALLDDELRIDAPYTQMAPPLDPAITALDATLAYDPLRHLLSKKGVMTQTLHDDLQLVGGVSVDFKKAVDVLFARSNDAQDSLFTRHPELKPLFTAYVGSTDPKEKKRAALLAAFRPELARRRKRQQALQRLTAAAGTELPFTQAVIAGEKKPFALHAAGDDLRPALDDVLAVDTPGLKAEFFFRATATGAVDSTKEAEAALDYAAGGPNPLPNPGSPVSGIWSGRVETAEAGFYNFIIEADSTAAVTLEIGGQPVVLKRNDTLLRNQDALELKGGALYEIKLTVENVQTRLTVGWETPKRPREIIPGRYLYPPKIFKPFGDLYVRFFKSASLAQALALTPKELVHFATSTDDQVDGDGWLNVLPVTSTLAGGVGPKLLKPLQSLLDFARIKAETSPGAPSNDEQLLEVLENPTTAAATMHWDEPSLTALRGRFGLTTAALAHLASFRRVHDAFAVVGAMGIAASTLLDAATNEPGPNVIRSLQGALRARYELADWRTIVQPVNDRLRALQRDALVAWILHNFRSDSTTAHIDTPDKLFEFFLMDVQMEPCMLTSRIRHALSSVQLFIERCLMNLETQVSSSSIDARQWQWMKRYRVWEANRKVYLFPENWLEPELRDDKSPFFKEIESELLQSDITEESATTAVMNYLTKLEEVAKLEPCAITFIGSQQEGTDVHYVVARTPGAHRKYFYRRYEYGYWTPWEQIKLEIEDNPVLVVVWQDRLLLFWLRLMKEGPQSSNKPPASSSKKLTDLTTADVPGDPQIKTRGLLCWSEYYNGKWQAAKTTDVNNPALISNYEPSRDFLPLEASENDEGSLVVHVRFQKPAFVLHNTHSLPDVIDEVWVTPTGKLRYGGFTFALPLTYSFVYASTIAGPLYRDFLRPKQDLSFTLPRPYANVWDAPFLMANSKHAFHVTTENDLVPLWNLPDYGYIADPKRGDFVGTIPGVVLKDPKLRIEEKVPWGDGGPGDPPLVNPNPIDKFITEDAHIRTALGRTGRVKYGNVDIGPQGAILNLKGGR